MRVRWSTEKAEASDEEDEGAGVAAVMSNLTIETAGTEEEVAENIEVMLNMMMKKAGGDVIEGKEGGNGTLGAL